MVPSAERSERGAGVEVSWQVPAHDAHEFFPRRTRFCLCIPVLDEDGRFQRQLAKMRRPDGPRRRGDRRPAARTAAPNPAALREAGVRTLLVKTGRGGWGRSCAWLRPGAPAGYQGVVLVDGNDKDDTPALALPRRALARRRLGAGLALPAGRRGREHPMLREAGVRSCTRPAISIAAATGTRTRPTGSEATARVPAGRAGGALPRGVRRIRAHYYLSIALRGWASGW